MSVSSQTTQMLGNNEDKNPNNSQQELVRASSKEIEDGCPAHLVLVSKLQPSIQLPQVIHLNKKEISFGRGADADVMLDSTRVPRMISRVHAKLASIEEKDEEGRHKWTIKDNKSVNGIFVNDLKVMDQTLDDGDVIVFGGGGNLAMGMEKKQEDSEFVYQIRYRKNTLKRKSSGIVTAEDVEEEAKKKQKLEEEEREKLRLQKELEERVKMLEEQERKIKEFQEKLEERDKEFASLQEKEMARTAEASNFHEQLQKLSEQFKEKEKAMEEEKAKALDEQQKHALELEQRAKEVEKQYKELEHAQVSANQKFEEEFTCVICQEMIMAALTLECSHSFCGVCISDWMKKKKVCPYCVTPITKEPIRSRVLDNAIDKLMQNAQPKEKENWERRMEKQKRLAAEQVQLTKIKGLIKTAKEKNLPFLNMSTNWSPNDRYVFYKGLKEYAGEARVLYCDTTGLNTNYINTANPIQLKTAAINLGISLVGIENNSQELKRRLSKLIDGTLEPMPNPPQPPPQPQAAVKHAQPIKYAVQPVKAAAKPIHKR